jgi:hypothetical protein
LFVHFVTLVAKTGCGNWELLRWYRIADNPGGTVAIWPVVEQLD